MLIIGCDYHPGFQQIAWVDTETGKSGERRPAHPGRSRAVLPRIQATKFGRAGGDGIQRTLGRPNDLPPSHCRKTRRRHGCRL